MGYNADANLKETNGSALTAVDCCAQTLHTAASHLNAEMTDVSKNSSPQLGAADQLPSF